MNISPMKYMVRWGKKRKLSHCYVGPFGILEEIRDRAYRLVLRPKYQYQHNVFHISMHKKYIYDESHGMHINL